ncbi:MAG: hypothetical protein ACRDTF_10730 [Pseudonocardiaceae bacterium]
MTIATWPVVDRRRVVHAYKPGEPSAAEGPFRTLREHAWASAGVRVTRRAGGRLAGQMTVFSSLNVESARLARHGNPDAAARVARAAAQLEAGPEFVRLQRILSDLPGHEAERVIDGVLPDDPPAALAEALKAVARRTEQLRAGELILATLAEVTAGRIAEVHEGYVVLVRVSGPAAMVPRWMAVAAGRDKVGELLALVMDKLDDASAVVDAVPAIDVAGEDGFSPFGRGDARVRNLTQADARLLAGEPQPLRILVPILIEA